MGEAVLGNAQGTGNPRRGHGRHQAIGNRGRGNGGERGVGDAAPYADGGGQCPPLRVDAGNDGASGTPPPTVGNGASGTPPPTGEGRKL